MALIINMLGGPGRGKSTAAYILAGQLKATGYKAELLTEYVKWPAYKKDTHEMADQLYLMAQHNHRLNVLDKLVDIVVTDTSLLNTLAYTNSTTEQNLAVELYGKYDNLNILIPRKEVYMQYGRSQTLEEAVEIDNKLVKLFKTRDIRYVEIVKSDKLYEDIYSIVTVRVNGQK